QQRGRHPVQPDRAVHHDLHRRRGGSHGGGHVPADLQARRGNVRSPGVLELLRYYEALALASAFVFGLLTGSFLNVVILRLPPWLEWRWKRDSRDMLEMEQEAEDPAPPGIVVESSHCPQCGHKL